MNCPICNSELKSCNIEGLFKCPVSIFEPSAPNSISHYERAVYQTGIKHSLYMLPLSLAWWEDGDETKVRLIGDFHILAHEKANNLEEVVRVGNRYLKLLAFL